MKVTYSIVAPIYNEKENLLELHRRVSEVMKSTRKRWELVLVDDGSTDGSTDMIRELAKEDKHVRPVIFARNFGHQIAITAGWDYARGDAVVIIRRDMRLSTQSVRSVRVNPGSSCGPRHCSIGLSTVSRM